jgi:hypothetical protein
MAQTGYTPILIYSSSTASQAPAAGNLTNSTLGSELAINITDGKLFYKDNANAIQVIGWKTVPTTAGGTGLTSYTAGDLLYYASGTTLTKLGIGAANTVLTSSGTAPQWSTNLTIGSLSATSISDSGNLTFTGTGNRITGDFSNATIANRVAFQNSIVNAGTVITALPNGTATSSSLNLFNNSDPTNAARAFFVGGASAVTVGSTITGTGTLLPLVIDVGGEKARFFTSGGVSIGNTTDPGAGNLSVTGFIRSNSPVLSGYATGAGGTVTQGAGSGKATAVTLNKPTGQITMNNATLNAGVRVTFDVNNNLVSSNDNVILNLGGGSSNPDDYLIRARMFSGGFAVSVINQGASNLSEAIVINFCVIKGATS